MEYAITSFPKFFSVIQSYDSKTTDKREQNDWKVEKIWMGRAHRTGFERDMRIYAIYSVKTKNTNGYNCEILARPNTDQGDLPF